MKLRYLLLLSCVAIVTVLACASCSSLPPMAVRVEGKHGTYAINPDGVAIDIKSTK